MLDFVLFVFFYVEENKEESREKFPFKILKSVDIFLKNFQKSFGKLQKSERGHTRFLRANSSLGNFTLGKQPTAFQKIFQNFEQKKDVSIPLF